MTVIADATFWGRGYGVLAFRSWTNRENVYWNEIETETCEAYYAGRKALEEQGYVIQAVVLDGKKGVRQLFYDVPVQICHFHQIATIRRYLTKKPKLEASKELWDIAKTLTCTNEHVFTKRLFDWHDTWKDFLKERTYADDGKHWHYTHKRLRSAFRSLKTNLPYLFTYQKYPELNIPNTTNSLDGSFTHLKDLLQLHRGLTKKRRWRLIQEIMGRK